MSNEKFKVKFGLAVGDTVATVDGTTGEGIFAENNDGQVIVGAGSGDNGRVEIGKPGRTVAGTPYVDFHSSANSPDYDVRLLAFGGSATDGTGTLNVEASTVAVYGDLNVRGGDITNSTGELRITSGATNTDIKITPNGTGDIYLTSDNIVVGDLNTNVSVTTLGSGNLTFSTNGSSNSGIIQIAAGANNNITLTPNGTGTTVVNSNLAVQGGSITTSQTTGNLFNTNATTVNIAGVATTVSIGANTGTTTVNNDLVADSLSVSGNLAVNGGDITTTSTTATVFNTTATTVKLGEAATTVSIGANTGTTTVNNDLVADSFSGAGGTFGNVTVGVDTDNTISTTTGNLVLDSATGIITLNSSGVTGVTLTPITSQIPYTLFAGNMVKGAIRNAPTEAGGNIFSFSAAGTGGPTRGLSIDNSIATAQRPGAVLRAYGGGLAGGNPVTYLITETAKGSAATPTGLASGNSLGSWLASGYADTSVGGADPGWATDTTGSNLASAGFITTEAFTSGTTNLGTQFSIRTNPTGSGNAIQTSMAINPQSTISRSDAFTWQNGKTNSNQKMLLDSTNILTLNATTGEVTLRAGDVNIIQANSTWQSALAPGFKYTGLMSSSTLTGTGSYFEMSSRWKASSGTATYDPPQNTWGLGRFGFSADNSTTGTNQVNSGAIQAKATENWTSTATGSSLNFSANKAGVASTSVEVLNISPENAYVQSDTITLSNSSFTQLTGNKIVYNRVYGQWQYDATLTPAAINTAYAIPFQGTNAVTDFSNIATASNTSQIKPNALGMYKLQFSAQVENSDNGADHTITFWWRKNGTDITNSAGYFTVPKAAAASGALIVGWDNMVEVTTITDYFELVYAVSDVAVTLPFIAASAPRPGAAAVFLTLVPVGA